MLKRFMLKSVRYALLPILVGMLLTSCETGVESSPQPGIIEITLRANPDETFIVERADTFSVFSPYQTRFFVSVFQGKAYQGETFATLFPTLTSYEQRDSSYNLYGMNFSKAGIDSIYYHVATGNISFEDVEDEGQREFVRTIIRLENGELKYDEVVADYKQYTVFRSYLPPGHYNKVEFGVGEASGDNARLRVVAKSGKTFDILLEVPPEDEKILSFDVDFDVAEGGTTRIDFEIDPTSSVFRYRDVYRFTRNMRILGVEQY